MNAAPELSVWATGQRASQFQRAGRYVPAAMAHPAKMLPAIAAQAIARYSKPGDLVLDPMCGIGTTLVEAVHQGRRALGVEYERRWAGLAAVNLAHAKRQGAPGDGEVLTGDARDLLNILGHVHGPAALVLTSPPYGPSTHGQVRSSRDSNKSGLRKWDHRYSTDPANLAHRDLGTLVEGFTQIIDGCRQILAPGGTVAVTARPFRHKGELVDVPGHVIRAAAQAGLALTGRHACLLCGLRDDQLVPRASFFQILETRRHRDNGLPVHIVAHEDLLLFQRPEKSASSRILKVSRQSRRPAPETGDHLPLGDPVRRARPRHRPRREGQNPAAEATALQLGRCRPCAKYRYGSRTKARRAAKLLHPGHDLQAYRCRHREWHFGHPVRPDSAQAHR